MVAASAPLCCPPLPRLSSSCPCLVSYDLSDCALWMIWVCFLTQFISQDQRKAQVGVFLTALLSFAKINPSSPLWYSDRNRVSHGPNYPTTATESSGSLHLRCISSVSLCQHWPWVPVSPSPLKSWWLWASSKLLATGSASPWQLPSVPGLVQDFQVNLLASGGCARRAV